MERLDTSLLANPILHHEHITRYAFAFDLVSGRGLDCASGIGYGTNFISKKSAVSNVTGIDISEDAVNYATNNYGNPKCNFIKESILELQYSQELDFFLSFETLEHLEKPEVAVDKVYKSLKNTGVFIGSVPTALYEEECTNYFGKNEHHIQKFSEEGISQLLKRNFKFVKLLKSEMYFGTMILPCDGETTLSLSEYSNYKSKNKLHGSYIFCATNCERMYQKINDTATSRLEIGPSFIELDKTFTQHLKVAISANERMINEKDDYIRRLELLVEDYKSAFEAENKLQIERTESLKEAIAINQNTLEERDKCIDSLTKRLEDYMAAYEAEHNLQLARSNSLLEIERKYNAAFLEIKKLKSKLKGI